MERTPNEEQKNGSADIPNVIIPQDELLRHASCVYQPPLIFKFLNSEILRKDYYCDRIRITKESSITCVLALRDLCRIVIAKQFKSGKLDFLVLKEDLLIVSELLNTELNLKDFLDIDFAPFWKRFFLAKCTDSLLKCQKIHDPFTNFKIESVQLKLTEIIETTAYEKWDDEEMAYLAKTVASHVQTLRIRKMEQMKGSVPPDEERHHGSLEMIGFLQNLKEVHIELSPPDQGRQYDIEYFHFSNLDIDYLSMGLSRLAHLNHLFIKRSRFDDEKKIKNLIRGLFQLPLETIDLSYCELRDNSGVHIGTLLHKVKTIKVLELKGNVLGQRGLMPIYDAIRTYTGTLEYLGTIDIISNLSRGKQKKFINVLSSIESFAGLARNPVTDDGVYMLKTALADTNQVTHLNLNGIEVSPVGGKYALDLLGFSVSLRKMEICCVPLEQEDGNRLIEILKTNKFLYHLDIGGCGLNVEQEIEINFLLSRNGDFSNRSNLLKNDRENVNEKHIKLK